MFQSGFLKRHEYGIAGAKVSVDIVQLLSAGRRDSDSNADVFTFCTMSTGNGVLGYFSDMIADDSDHLILKIGVGTPHDLDWEVTGELK